MARNPKATTKKSQDRRPRPGAASSRPRRGKPKVCIFCSKHATWVDYKDIGLLKRFVNDRGRIKARGATGTCSQHQGDVATAVKTARELALLPYSVRAASAEPRGPRTDRRGPNAGSQGGDAFDSDSSPEQADGVDQTEVDEDDASGEDL